MTQKQKQAAINIYKFYYRHLNWCGCGNPEEVMILLRGVLAVLRWNFADRPKEIPHEIHYEEFKDKIRSLLGEIGSPLCLSYFYMLDAAGITEHGGGLVNGGWLTRLCEQVLNDLETLGDIEWDVEEIANAVYAEEGKAD